MLLLLPVGRPRLLHLWLSVFHTTVLTATLETADTVHKISAAISEHFPSK